MPKGYNPIAPTYNNTRKADPYLVQRMVNFLSPSPQGHYLDIGCGTGNYTIALSQQGYQFTGVDPSPEMLAKGRTQSPQVDWVKGTAEHIPLPDHTFDGVIATLTLHHWADIGKGFQEVARVLRPGCPFVIFTTTPEQTGAYWLRHYFPKTIASSTEVLPSMEKITTCLQAAGLTITQTEKYFIQPDLEDHFLYSGKHNPARYLDPGFRMGISSFTHFAHQDEVQMGLQHMEEDINSGVIYDIIREHENELGDYLFVKAVLT